MYINVYLIIHSHTHTHIFHSSRDKHNSIKISTKTNTENPALMFKHDGHLIEKALISCHPLHVLN